MARLFSRPGAWLRSLCAAAGALLLVTCTDNPMAPRGQAALAVQPRWDASVRFVPLVLDRARLVVTDPASDQVLLDVSRPFDASSNQLTLEETVPLGAQSLDVDVTLELDAVTVPLFSGQSRVTLTRGGRTQPATPVLTYVGPGANAAALLVAPRDSVVQTGATLAMRATATDAAQQPVPDFYVHWSVVGATSATIDAAGSLSTGASRDTVFVKAVLPNGVADSARLFVLPAPAALVKQAGDNQTGTTGARLAQPLAVQVNGGDGQPLPGVVVAFAAATGGGSVDSSTATADAQGIARTGATLGATAGTQTFTASAPGLASVTFSATAAAASTTRTWNGLISTDWSVAGNWTPASVPTNANDVVIPTGTPNAPTVTASCSALSLTVNVLAVLNLGAVNCQVNGFVFADGQILGAGAVQISTPGQVRGRISNLQASGPVTAVGLLSVSGNVTTTGAAGDLIVNGQKVNISGNLTTQGGAVFTMTNPLDTVQVLGNATFSGGSTLGHLTQGGLIVGGSFAQSTTAASFSANGNHKVTILGAVNHAVSFSDAVNSHFQALDVGSNAATYTLAGNVTVLGQLLSKPTGITRPVVTTASGSVLTAGGADITLLTLSGVPLVLSGGTIGSFSNVTFSNQPTTRAQLTVNNTGAGGPFTFTSILFSTTPVAPNGFYLDATDLDGATNGALTITMATPGPATPGVFLRTGGGAVVNWPSTTLLTWTGAADANYANAANWNPAIVPTATNDIVIPPTTNSPVLGSNLTVKSLTVNSGATFDIGFNTFNVAGSVLIDGTIAGGGAIQQTGTGQLRGTMPALTIIATATANGPVATTAGNLNISGGNLVLNGHTVTTSASVNTVNGGVLTMTNALDTVIALNMGFGGGDQAGLLTAGAIKLTGNLSVTGNTPATRGPLIASGTHTVIFTGAGNHLIQTLAGATLASLNNLDVTQATGSFSVTTLTATPAFVNVGGTFTAKPTGATPTFHGTSGGGISATAVNVSRLAVDTLTFTIGSGAVTQFDSVTFTNQPVTARQLTVNNTGAAQPYTFTALNFAVVPSTGFYLAATDVTVGDGLNLVINMVSPTPATPGGFVLATGGASVFWPVAAPVPVWTGNLSTDWSVGGNWSTGVLPGVADSVVIPSGIAQPPTLSADVTVGAVDTKSSLTLGGHTMAVVRTFSTSGNGKVVMTNPNDALVVLGNAIFAGGDETGLLTEGGVTISGNFTQLSGTSGASYQSSGAHVTALAGASPTVSFASPGTGATFSRFNDFAWSGTGTLTLLSNVVVSQITAVTGNVATIGSSGGFRLTTGTFANVAPVTFNNVPLTLDNAAGDAIDLTGLTFQNMATDVSQLVVNHPGLGGTYTFSGMVFSTTPVAPNGFYLDVTDATGLNDGGLTINVTASPASPGSFVRTAGGAVVQWPGPRSVAWGGTVSTDWNTAANWVGGQVPSAIDAVIIGPATFPPVLAAGVSVDRVQISGAGASLTLNGKSLTTNSLITDTDGILVMTNPADLVTVNGDAFFQGGNETGSLTAGEMRFGGNFNVGQQTTALAFRPSGSHRVVMTNPSVLQSVTICCTQGASGFQNLDISQSFGINIQFSNNGVFVADTFIVQPGAGPRPWLYMLGSPLTARRFKVNKLLVDRGTINLNENGVAGAQQFENVTFQDYLPIQTQLGIRAQGGAAAPRTITFNNLTFQTLNAGDTGRYVDITGTGGSLILALPGNNQGPVNGPLFSTLLSATINWTQ